MNSTGVVRPDKGFDAVPAEELGQGLCDVAVRHADRGRALP